LDREAASCARLDRRRGTCHTALIVLGLVLAWISIVVCAYHHYKPSFHYVLFSMVQIDYVFIFFQHSALPCALTTGGKRGGLHRFSSSRPNQSSHHRYLFTLGSSPRERTTESLEILQISLWSMWVQERQRNHRNRKTNARRLLSRDFTWL
jgi:hypothetical protein